MQDAGGGMVFWHPKGSVIRRVIEDYWKDEHVKVRVVISCILFVLLSTHRWEFKKYLSGAIKNHRVGDNMSTFT